MTAKIIEDVFDVLHAAFDVILYAELNKPRADDLKKWIFEDLALNDGTQHSIHNLRIAVSIAFEIKTGNVPPRLIFENILNREDEKGKFFISTSYPEPAHAQFHKACFFDLPSSTITKADYTKFHTFYRCAFQTKDHPPDGYARCLNLPSFFNYFVTMDENYKTKSIKLKDYLKQYKWNENYNVGVTFPEIPAKNNVNMRGMKPMAWIAPYIKMKPVLKLTNPPLELAQRLGIYIKSNANKDPLYYDVLMLICYDKSFNESVYQPASIHADWNSGGFVSYKQNDDCYGLTYNCYLDGDESFPERVHISFPVITVGPGAYKHSALIVGRVDQGVILDYDKILSAAFARFAEL